MAKLYFRYGAMGSSKTAQALMLAYNYRERGHQVFVFKPKIDNREGIILKSRCGIESNDVILFDNDTNFRDIVSSYYSDKNTSLDIFEDFCANKDVIVIDECQFLNKQQVIDLANIVDDLRLSVFCYGLRTNFKGELFEGSTWLMAYADTIEEVKTICRCGKKATFNARIQNGEVVKEGKELLIGGNETYISLCRKHWSNGNKDEAWD